jgi:all-trans-retinol 13,14-reductase
MNSTSIALDNTADKTPFLFISNESAKDPDFPLKHPGKSTSEVIAMVKYDLFKQWEHTSHKLRHADYLEMKDKITESYLEAFYLHFPQARGHVVFTSLGTPLTM